MPEVQKSLLEHAAPTPRPESQAELITCAENSIQGRNRISNDPLGIRPLIVQHFIENDIELLPGYEMDALVYVGKAGERKLLWIEDKPHLRQP